ncbi:MAG: kynureninase [Rhodospirillales bacterium]|jgi:kynureninase|nr:kynureninase [Rhodospirillaceae bacterium]MDP6428663.1 kynureninase [Rhodospirillales bacterium]MDP6644460.1 kynureninase [Rhodospirillales bacterium]|tara:strand:+ start:1893 stop:3104 length:1212 start_codon:yes stop_codon:yes gene_type:complete
MDQSDPLRDVRDLFDLPADIIYLDGNSLGPAPKAVFAEIEKTAKTEWANDLIRSWNSADWFKLVEQYGDKLAKILGADTGEVVICDSTSINLYKALYGGLSLRPDRAVIVAETNSFPTDLYITEGVAASRSDVKIRLEKEDEDNIEDLIDEDVAVVLVNHVDYRSGKIRDMPALTKIAHDAGAIIIWDLCHSAGILPVDLNGAKADLAVGCTYKYLNGGPGSPAYIFAAKRHIEAIGQPLSGWWGHANPFAFDVSYQKDRGIRKFLCGTQPILSLRALKSGLEIYEKLDMRAVRTKSMTMTDMFIDLVDNSCGEFGIAIYSPREASKRAGQVALTFEHGYAVAQALIEQGVIGDFRAPNILRYGFSPLYNTYGEVCTAAASLNRIMKDRLWDQERFHKRLTVT